MDAAHTSKALQDARLTQASGLRASIGHPNLFISRSHMNPVKGVLRLTMYPTQCEQSCVYHVPP